MQLPESETKSALALNDEEAIVFLRTKQAFLNYFDHAISSEVTCTLAAVKQLSSEYQNFAKERLIPHIMKLKKAIEENGSVCRLIGSVYDLDLPSEVETTSLDESKVLSVLRQLSREWSADGKRERLDSYGRLLHALDAYFPNVDQRGDIKVLIPGSGLGRLPYEVSLLGFNAVGNDFSSHMILASQTVLNLGLKKNEYTIYPYIHSHSHWRNQEDQLRAVQIPDVSFDQPQLGEMSMAIGDLFDFALSDSFSGEFDAVVTSFFIDAPFNFFKTLDALTNVTKQGGIWLNFGPLHWHSDISGGPTGEPQGIELSLEDVLAAVKLKGWSIIEHKADIPATYCSTHPNRMGRMVFNCEFWLAKKLA